MPGQYRIIMPLWREFSFDSSKQVHMGVAGAAHAEWRVQFQAASGGSGGDGTDVQQLIDVVLPLTQQQGVTGRVQLGQFSDPVLDGLQGQGVMSVLRWPALFTPRSQAVERESGVVGCGGALWPGEQVGVQAVGAPADRKSVV